MRTLVTLHDEIKIYLVFFFTLIFLSPPGTAVHAQSGANDTLFNSTNAGFDSGNGPNGIVYATVIQNDGKILIGGNFTNCNGIAISRIARLNADGTVDMTFNTGAGADNSIRAIAVQSDGKILIAGNFTFYNGLAANRVARLNTDGTLDLTFNAGLGANLDIYALAVQSDGKIIIGGAFSWYNGIPRNRLARINSDGSLETTSLTGPAANNTVRTISIQSDGRIIIGGSFTEYNGVPNNHIARLNIDGTLDAAFESGTGASSRVLATAIQSDGKILLGGNFDSYNGTSSNKIARLNADGTLDLTFNAGSGTSHNVRALALQGDGKILIAGFFTSVNGNSANHIARLNADGSMDATFNPGAGVNGSLWAVAVQNDGQILIGGNFNLVGETDINNVALLESGGSVNAAFNPGSGASIEVYTTAVQSDGKIVAGGFFSYYDGVSRSRIARLNSDGTLDETFNPGNGANGPVRTIAIQNDGKIFIGGSFTYFSGTLRRRIARLNADGSLDDTFNPGIGINGDVYSLALQSDGKLIIGGNFTTYNGSPIKNIARVNPDGTLDATFNPGSGANEAIRTVLIQADGKIIIGGMFTAYNGTGINRIARINSDGNLDTTFDPGTGANDTVLSSALQLDGKILIGGAFQSVNGNNSNRIARLNADGLPDPTFNSGIGANDLCYSILYLSNGQLIFGGAFTSYNGTPANGIVRVNTDGIVDATFDSGTGANDAIYTTSLQSDGNVIIGGSFTAYDGAVRSRIARIINVVGFVGIDSAPFAPVVSIYPNPTSEQLNIELPGRTTITNFEIVNPLGQVVSRGSFSEKTVIQTSGFAPSVYFIRLDFDGVSEIQRFIKQ